MPSSRGWDVQTCQGGGDPTGQGSKWLRLGAGRQAGSPRLECGRDVGGHSGGRM